MQQLLQSSAVLLFTQVILFWFVPFLLAAHLERWINYIQPWIRGLFYGTMLVAEWVSFPLFLTIALSAKYGFFEAPLWAFLVVLGLVMGSLASTLRNIPSRTRVS